MRYIDTDNQELEMKQLRDEIVKEKTTSEIYLEKIKELVKAKNEMSK